MRPDIDPDGDLTPREELELFRYYSWPHDTETTDRDARFDRDDDHDDRLDRGLMRDQDTPDDHQRVVDEIADRRDEGGHGRLRRYVVSEITEDR
jgi:hypothetical protein